MTQTNEPVKEHCHSFQDFLKRENLPPVEKMNFNDYAKAAEMYAKHKAEMAKDESVNEVGGMSDVHIGAQEIVGDYVDDDGNHSIAHMAVEILNQRPVALFERPVDGKIGDAYVFSSSSFDPDGDTSSLIHIWTFSDREGTIENVSSVSRTFSKPGLYSISLEVVDERGLESAPKVFLIFIENPLKLCLY